MVNGRIRRKCHMYLLWFVVITTQILTAPSCETRSRWLSNLLFLTRGATYFNPQTFNASSKTCTEKKPRIHQFSSSRQIMQLLPVSSMFVLELPMLLSSYDSSNISSLCAISDRSEALNFDIRSQWMSLC